MIKYKEYEEYVNHRSML